MADITQGGQALAAVPIGSMIQSYAMGVAEAQMALDRNSVTVMKELMKTVDFPDAAGNIRPHSLLELGFAPTFYHFSVCTIKIRVDIKMSTSTSTKVGVQANASLEKKTVPGQQANSNANPSESTPPVDEANMTPAQKAAAQKRKEEADKAAADKAAADANKTPAAPETSSTTMLSASVSVEHSVAFNFEMSASSEVNVTLTAIPAPTAFLDALETARTALKLKTQAERAALDKKPA